MVRSDLYAKLSSLLGVDVPSDALSEEEIAYLRDNMHRLRAVEEIWAAMNAEWVANGAGFEEAQREAMDRFYSAPIWLLNGIFTEVDPVSRNHREAIRDFVVQQEPALITDYGGGFGALARQIACAVPDARVVVVEPFPRSLALSLASQHRNLEYSSDLPVDADIVIAQDVLEHVTDPLSLFSRLVSSTRVDGKLIIANCFQPVIRCHYPGAFHFHFTFSKIAPFLGCQRNGTVPMAPHAQVFRRTSEMPNWGAARRLERISRAVYPLLKALQELKRGIAGPRRQT